MMKTARQAPPPASMREASGWTSAVSPGEIADLPNIPGLELIFGFEAERPRRAEHHGREAQTGYVLSSLNVIFVGQVAHEGADGKARIEYPLPVDPSIEGRIGGDPGVRTDPLRHRSERRSEQNRGGT